MKSEDFIAKLGVASTHDTMLCFSTLGKIYWSKVYEFPQAGRQSKGKPINNILPLEQGEKITAMVGVSEFKDDLFVFMATKKAVVKKVSLSAFSRPRKMGIYALSIDDDDELMDVVMTDGSKEIMMFSDAGKAIRFDEQQVRAMGRTARGVRGMRISEDAEVVALLATESNIGVVLTATEHGYGKRTSVSEYRCTSRGSQGVISISTSDRNGEVVSAVLVNDTDDVMLMTDQGTLVRTPVCDIRETGRSAQGVTLINLNKGEKLVTLQTIQEDELSEDDIDQTDPINPTGDSDNQGESPIIDEE
jgi:DNA gyrase subunit A